MNKKKLFQTKKLIYKVYNINNSIPKGYGIRSLDYKDYYRLKEKLILKIINNIKTFNLPIKYGMKDCIYYFVFDGKQFSFHGYYGKIKIYSGNWIGTKRKRLLSTKNGIYGRRNLY